MKTNPKGYTTSIFSGGTDKNFTTPSRTRVDGYTTDIDDNGNEYIIPEKKLNLKNTLDLANIENQLDLAPGEIAEIPDYDVYDATVNKQPSILTTNVKGRKVDDDAVTELTRLRGLKNLNGLERGAILSTSSLVNDPEFVTDPYDTSNRFIADYGKSWLCLPEGVMGYNSDLLGETDAIHELIHCMNALTAIADPDYFEIDKSFGKIHVFKGDVPALNALLKLTRKIGPNVNDANKMMLDVMRNDRSGLAKFKIESIYCAMLLPYILAGASKKDIQRMEFDLNFKEPLSKLGSGFHDSSYFYNFTNGSNKPEDNKYAIYRMLDELRATYGEAIGAGGGAKTRSHITGFSRDMNERMKLVIKFLPPESRKRLKAALRDISAKPIKMYVPSIGDTSVSGVLGFASPNQAYSDSDFKARMDSVRNLIINAVKNGKFA